MPTKKEKKTVHLNRKTIILWNENIKDKGTVRKRIENPYVSRNPQVPDYLEKVFYSAKQGQEHAERMKLWKGRELKIKGDKALLEHLEKRIADDKFSPDAAIGEIKAQGLAFSVSICTKTLYNMIDRGDFHRLTNKNLPVKRNKSQRVYKKIGTVAKNNVKGRSIEQRPQWINERKEVGHWEMDLLVGKGTTCLQVLTERVTRKELIIRIPNKKQQTIVQTLDKLEKEYKKAFYTMFKSITMDNGTEFVDQMSSWNFMYKRRWEKDLPAITLTPTAHGKGEVMKMQIALLGVLSRKAQTLLSIATNQSKRLNSGSTIIQENYLTMKLPINSIRRYHNNLFWGNTSCNL